MLDLLVEAYTNISDATQIQILRILEFSTGIPCKVFFELKIIETEVYDGVHPVLLGYLCGDRRVDKLLGSICF